MLSLWCPQGPFFPSPPSLQWSSRAASLTAWPPPQGLKPLIDRGHLPSFSSWLFTLGNCLVASHDNSSLSALISAGCERELLRGEAAVRAKSELRVPALTPPPISSSRCQHRAGQPPGCAQPWSPSPSLIPTLTDIPLRPWSCPTIVDDLLPGPDSHPLPRPVLLGAVGAEAPSPPALSPRSARGP